MDINQSSPDITGKLYTAQYCQHSFLCDRVCGPGGVHAEPDVFFEPNIFYRKTFSSVEIIFIPAERARIAEPFESVETIFNRKFESDIGRNPTTGLISDADKIFVHSRCLSQTDEIQT